MQGRVVRHVDVPVRRAKAPKVTKVMIYDGTALAALVGFGKRAGYLKVSLHVDDVVVVTGKFKRARGGDARVEATTFEYEVLSDEDAELVHTGRLVPVYRLTADMPQRALRTFMARIASAHAPDVPEALPEELRRRRGLMHKPDAIRQIHLPDSVEALRLARERLVFEEFYLLQLGLLLRKESNETAQPGIAFRTDGPKARRLREALPFTLTDAQERALAEIESDMRRDTPMSRLLQGDVGSGKTIVAGMALAHAVETGLQGAIMAPTEILAEQHYRTLSALFQSVDIRAVLLKGDMPAATRRDAAGMIESGEADVAVGTHALIQDAVEFADLGLVVTDEQHRFGVMQRAKFRSKGHAVDTLVMTATPIPRTLALTAYGDLTLSVIDQLPPGRKPIVTKQFTDSGRDHLYRFVESQLKKGRQTYVIYPLIEESEKLEDIQAAVDGHEQLSQRFADWRVGLLHGRLPGDEKSEIMQRFHRHEIDVLVSTTVIEVGVDVPNANVMVVEHADRFGLAQLHQLRGRVGRGEHESYCALVGWPKSDDARRRLDVMVATTDGFVIAEEDLKIRGPGEILGTRQAGMPDLKLASLITDSRVLEAAREDASALIQADPTLADTTHTLLRETVLRAWGGKLRLASVG
ncbi:ATP-dependent DNA helicase RecG [Candidatus Poribacteria bacterium]|nr:ATP-dependent DNA helicase RecG [Candidatus Poribacteria bacterium]